jgi:ribosomal protein S21
MPIIIKANPGDSLGDLIRKFKKQTGQADIVQKARDRAVFRKKSQLRAVKKIEKARLRKRTRSLKKMKNISPQVIQRLHQRLAE